MTVSRSIERAQALAEARGRVALSHAETLARRKGYEALAFAERDPKRAVGYVVGSVGIAYLAFRATTYPPLWLLGGTAELNGQRYRITNTDMLWLARMVYGETGGDDEAKAAVLWSVLTRHMSKPSLYQTGSLTKTIRMFAQPLSPLWATPFGCEGGRGCCGTFWGACSPTTLLKRANVRWSSWYMLPGDVRDAVTRFVRGELPNPVPGANNFAMSISAAERSGSVQAGFQPVTIRSNTFIRDAGSTPGAVRFV
jgi:hypothetical protein